MNTAALKARRRAILAILRASGLDALLTTKPENWYYLTGFTGDSGALVVSRAGYTLVTDGRYTTQARAETRGVGLIVQKGSLSDATGHLFGSKGFRSIGYDPAAMTVGQLQQLRRAAQGRPSWVGIEGAVEGLRACKDSAEIQSIRLAGALAGEVLETVLQLLKPGVREFEIAAEIEYQMRRRGAQGSAFETIVAFGERSALPHAQPTARKLRKNELVVLDLGAILGHYCSDITRTVFVGRAPARIRGWYKAVLEAQSMAIASIHEGACCGDVDAAARSVLESYGLGRQFVHSTGHGLGLEVHEAPRLVRGQKGRLVRGNVVTVEPGVYVPGVGGIRIEDDVAVHAGRNEVLTRIPRDFIEL